MQLTEPVALDQPGPDQVEFTYFEMLGIAMGIELLATLIVLWILWKL